MGRNRMDRGGAVWPGSDPVFMFIDVGKGVRHFIIAKTALLARKKVREVYPNFSVHGVVHGERKTKGLLGLDAEAASPVRRKVRRP